MSLVEFTILRQSIASCLSNGGPDRNSIGMTRQGESLGPSRKREDYKNYN